MQGITNLSAAAGSVSTVRNMLLALIKEGRIKFDMMGAISFGLGLYRLVLSGPV